MTHITGHSRYQSTLFPEVLDEVIPEDHQVRVIDAFVDTLDLAGLGDSVCPDSTRENDPYPATAFRDIAGTLNHLQSQLGVRKVVLMGLCSGAYAAF